METKQPLSIMEAASEATERLAKALAIKEENQQDCDFLEGYNKGYNHGAEWQKEQDKELIKQLLDLQININDKVGTLPWPIVDAIKQHFNL